MTTAGASRAPFGATSGLRTFLRSRASRDGSLRDPLLAPDGFSRHTSVAKSAPGVGSFMRTRMPLELKAGLDGLAWEIAIRYSSSLARAKWRAEAAHATVCFCSRQRTVHRWCAWRQREYPSKLAVRSSIELMLADRILPPAIVERLARSVARCATARAYADPDET